MILNLFFKIFKQIIFFEIILIYFYNFCKNYFFSLYFILFYFSFYFIL